MGSISPHQSGAFPFTTMSLLRTMMSGVPIAQVLRSHSSALAGIAGIVVISAAALYFVLVFMPVYASTALDLPPRQVQLVTIVCACAEVPVILIAARLADAFAGGRAAELAAP